MRPADLNFIVQECQKLLERLVSENISLKFELHPGPLRIKADQGQIGQVLMNLVINAQDAIINSGTITVMTSLLPLDTLNLLGLPAGDYAELEIHDTGVGMSAEVADHIFEPFFTTKKEMGTGLGLSTSYGIVQLHQGCIHVESEPGIGTAFTVLLPVIHSEFTEMETDTPSSIARGRTET